MIKTVVSEVGESDGALESTFNLGLSLAEKEARNKVQMPFWRPEQRGGGGGGKVFYVADQVDDCDEEDPDDELNI